MSQQLTRRGVLGGLIPLIIAPGLARADTASLIDWANQPAELQGLRATAPTVQPRAETAAPAEQPAAPAVSDSQRAVRHGTRTVHAISRRDERVHTVPYFIDGQYVDDTSPDVNQLLADWRTGETADMSRRLLDIQWQLRQALGTDEAFYLISAYRSPATNSALATNSGGVARNSLHMSGMALDLRLQSRSVSQIARAARSLGMGGVGTYTSSNFVHIDSGGFRTWGA